MTKPSEIKLLVFDLDGTIFESQPATFKVMRQAFLEMGIDTPITEDDVRRHMGEPAEQFFSAILGPRHAHLWPELMVYDEKIPEFGNAFPGVAETLKTLKDRGYKLALYSNCAPSYFNSVLSKTSIRPYFDYAECNGENNLTKNELVRKIIVEKFKGLKSAVIGDRIHDIDAARQNRALSVGVLYGYGGDEPYKADMTIKSFPELLKIFKGRT